MDKDFKDDIKEIRLDVKEILQRVAILETKNKFVSGIISLIVSVAVSLAAFLLK